MIGFHIIIGGFLLLVAVFANNGLPNLTLLAMCLSVITF